MKQAFICILLLMVSMSPIAQAAVQSVHLNDTIRLGKGSINLFDAKIKDDLSGADMEAMRQEHNGALVFAIDVNEAASGTEKASSQGVAVESAVLTVVVGGNSFTFTGYSTPTESLLAKTGSTERSSYYTLIGQTGSSLLTPNSDSDLSGSSFDALLTMPVNMSLEVATSAVLEITFLETNTSLGDPEAII